MAKKRTISNHTWQNIRSSQRIIQTRCGGRVHTIGNPPQRHSNAKRTTSNDSNNLCGRLVGERTRGPSYRMSNYSILKGLSRQASWAVAVVRRVVLCSGKLNMSNLSRDFQTVFILYNAIVRRAVERCESLTSILYVAPFPTRTIRVVSSISLCFQ
jgi:hypothetical protein